MRTSATPLRGHLWLAKAVVFAAFCLVCRSSHAYALEGVQWPAGSIITFQVALGSPGRTLMDGNTSWNTAAAPAPTTWNSVVANLDFEATPESATAVSGDGLNTIVFASSVFGDSFGSSTLAVTYYISSGSRMQEADVLFNNHQTFDSYRGPLRYDGSGFAIGDIRRVLVHELGHALGLDHPDDHGQHVDAIMNSITSDRETLSSDDIAGAQHLYGVPRAITVKADFNADQRADYVLVNTITSRTAIWYLSGNRFLGSNFGPTLPTGWTLVCTADVDRDGNSDYLLWNSGTGETRIWYLDHAAFVEEAVGPRLPAGWTLIAAADMNSDGHSDYVLFNQTTRQTAVWFLNASTFIGSAWGPSIPAGWTLIDVSDFNANGNPDLVLFNPGSRQTAIWYMNGTRFSSGLYGPSIALGWVLQGTADFNHDGKPDYVLVNAGTNQTAQWYLSGVTLTSSAYGPTIPPYYILVCR